MKKLQFNPQYIRTLGFAGCTASGKSTFVRDLKENLPEGAVTILSLDNYYKPKDQQPRDSITQEINFDLPECFFWDEYLRDLRKLKAGLEVTRPEYLFGKEGVPPLIISRPSPIIIGEGLFLFHEDEVASEFDLKAYVDAMFLIRYGRRVERDKAERSYDYRMPHIVITQVMPGEDFILATKDKCDIVINNNISYERALDMLTRYCKTIFEESKVL